jgi:hypothetical protein
MADAQQGDMMRVFDRAAACDLVDVYVLSREAPKAALLELACEVDSGFDVHVSMDALRHLARTSVRSPALLRGAAFP